jgi:hypothetical protein
VGVGVNVTVLVKVNVVAGPATVVVYTVVFSTISAGLAKYPTAPPMTRPATVPPITCKARRLSTF